MKFAWLVARRYLRSPNRPAVLRLVTLLAVVGVASGVATLVIALAMNTGFRITLQDRLLGVTAHVTISRPGSEALNNYREFAERLARVPGVKAVAPAIYITVLLSSAGARTESSLRGLILHSSPNAMRRCKGWLPEAPISLPMPTASIPSSWGGCLLMI